MNAITTTNLSEFGFRERDEATKLLTAYSKQNPDFLNDGVKVMFNKHSGYVFLIDEDYNVAMIDDGILYQIYTCPECDLKGSEEDLMENGNSCCRAYVSWCLSQMDADYILKIVGNSNTFWYDPDRELLIISGLKQNSIHKISRKNIWGWIKDSQTPEHRFCLTSIQEFKDMEGVANGGNQR